MKRASAQSMMVLVVALAGCSALTTIPATSSSPTPVPTGASPSSAISASPTPSPAPTASATLVTGPQVQDVVFRVGGVSLNVSKKVSGVFQTYGATHASTWVIGTAGGPFASGTGYLQIVCMSTKDASDSTLVLQDFTDVALTPIITGPTNGIADYVLPTGATPSVTISNGTLNVSYTGTINLSYTYGMPTTPAATANAEISVVGIPLN